MLDSSIILLQLNLVTMFLYSRLMFSVCNLNAYSIYQSLHHALDDWVDAIVNIKAREVREMFNNKIW